MFWCPKITNWKTRILKFLLFTEEIELPANKTHFLANNYAKNTFCFEDFNVHRWLVHILRLVLNSESKSSKQSFISALIYLQAISRFICERGQLEGQREFITLRIFLQFWYRRPVWALLRHLAVDFRLDHFRLVLYLNLVNLSQMILHYHLAQIREILQLFFSSFVFSFGSPKGHYLPVYFSEHNFSYFPEGFIDCSWKIHELFTSYSRAFTVLCPSNPWLRV